MVGLKVTPWVAPGSLTQKVQNKCVVVLDAWATLTDNSDVIKSYTALWLEYSRKKARHDVELTCQISDIRSIEQCIQDGMPYIRIRGEWAYNEGGFVQHEKQACLYVVHDTLVSPADILSGRYKPEEEKENRINHQEAKPSILRVLAAFMCRPSPVC